MTTLKQAEQAIANCEPFNTGTLTGTTEESDYGVILYVVRSYGVPIAQHDAFLADTGLVYVTAYDYSVTTSKHANIVKRAWGITA
jgi:hypothetical protein